MPRIVKIIIGILIVIFFITAVVIFLGIRLLRQSLPRTDGTEQVTGLNHSVKVYRDSFGVPHIFAQNEADLFFAMGYVVSQDRLWQMDLNRRAATGTLSEIFGTRTLETDKLIRTLGLPKIANQLTVNISAQAKEILMAYTAGINAFIHHHEHRLPNEFALLRYKSRPWKIEHSLAYQRLMAWSLEMAWRVDPVFGELAAKVGDKKLVEILPDYPDNDPAIIKAYYSEFSKLQKTINDIAQNLLSLTGFFGIGMGSNSWIVAGDHTNTGKPMLANDPHLVLQNPSIWYEIHLTAPGIDCYGVSLPGIPGIIMGQNQSIAWGLTNAMADGCDFFIEKINPVSQDQYLYQEKWHDTEKSEEEIFIQDQPPCTLITRSTHHGPIISDLHPALKDSSKVVSLKWNGYLMSDEVLAFAKIMKAKNWAEFIAGLQYFSIPTQNYIFADVAGNIGYYCAGSIPIRFQGSGLLPQPGWINDFEWKDSIPFERLPHLFNPISGLIITANHKVIDDNYPYFISTYWEPPYRAQRIKEFLTRKPKLSTDDFKKIQIDQYSKHAQFLIPFILQVMPTLDLNSKIHQYLYNELKKWDFNLNAQSVAPTIFEIFLIKLFKNIFLDEMGDTLFYHFLELPNIPIRVTDNLLTKGASQWFDNVATPDTIETLPDIIKQTLEETFQHLESNSDHTIYNLRWGNVHTLTFEHALGKTKPLDRLFNIGPFPAGGSCTSINNASYALTQNNFKVIVGPSMRQIMDLSNRKNSIIVITTGQCGHPLSKHYKDQTPLWLNGRYHNAITDSLEICNSGFDLLILKPE